MYLSSPGLSAPHKNIFLPWAERRRVQEQKQRQQGPGVGQHAHVLVHIPVGRAWPRWGWCTPRQLEMGTISYSVLPHADTRQRLDCNSHSPACTEGSASLPCPKSCSGILPFKTGVSPPTTHTLTVFWQVLINKLFLIALPLSVWLQWAHEQGGTDRLPASLPALLFPP